MSTDPKPHGEGPESEPTALPDLPTALPDGPITSERVLAELANVQVAHEELRVAEEEVRVQQEQITKLLMQHDADRRWRGQMSMLVPVALCVSDGNGALVDANPALAAHLGAGLHRLRGKPLSVYLAPEDVKEFRTALRTLSSGTATECRLTLAIRPRGRPPVRTSGGAGGRAEQHVDGRAMAVLSGPPRQADVPVHDHQVAVGHRHGDRSRLKRGTVHRRRHGERAGAPEDRRKGAPRVGRHVQHHQNRGRQVGR